MVSICEEKFEITLDYKNLPDATPTPKSRSGENAAVIPDTPGGNLYRLVCVTLGLLCILQATLNISLRLALYHYTQQEWVYFHRSFYYISSTKKSWQDSREDCLQRGADLVIINSEKEQNFTTKFRKPMWTGLAYRETKKIWIWVDGTPLTKSYWGPGEPNGDEDRIEECAEIRFDGMNSSWNDVVCENQNFWICEKTVAL